MAAPVASFSCARTRAVLDLYASLGCNHGELHRGCRARSTGDHALSARPSVRAGAAGGQVYWARIVIVAGISDPGAGFGTTAQTQARIVMPFRSSSNECAGVERVDDTGEVCSK